MEPTTTTLLPGWMLGLKRLRAVCAFSNCYNRVLVARIPNLHPGIMLDGTWYCSLACFAAGAASRVAALSRVRVLQREHSPRLSIGLILVAKGYLAETQLGSVSNEVNETGESSEEVILRLGLATEKQLASARAAQWGCAALGQDHVAVPIAVDLPLELLRDCSAVPLYYARSRKQLLLGFVQRPHHDLLQAIEKVTGCRPEVCFITEEEFQKQFEKLQPSPDYICQSNFQDSTAARIGRALAGYARDAAAEEARFSLCCNALWVRLAGRRGVRDMVIPAKRILECELSRPDASFSPKRLEPGQLPADKAATRENAARNLFHKLRLERYSRNRTGAPISV